MQNVEVDELSNGIFRAFDPARRVQMDLDASRFVLLPELLRYGKEFHDFRDKGVPGAPAADEATPLARGNRLKEVDPW
eukprot:551684-Alexandrium_andersonii.AAC.1